MSYLISAATADVDAHVVDGLVQMAASFLGASGATERIDLGTFRRAGRGKSPDDVLRLFRFTSHGPSEAAKARTLESVLRSTLASSGITSGEVRVFVSDERADPA